MPIPRLEEGLGQGEKGFENFEKEAGREKMKRRAGHEAFSVSDIHVILYQTIFCIIFNIIIPSFSTFITHRIFPLFGGVTCLPNFALVPFSYACILNPEQ